MTTASWLPLTPPDVAELFAAAPMPWWLAGGYAIEHAVGRPLREHADIDVLVLRSGHLAVQEVLAGWEWWAADPPGELRPWRAGEVLTEVHDIWCRPEGDDRWRLQIMIDGDDGDDWVSRRNPRVRGPIAMLGAGHVLAPEIQLFYKAKGRRPKDEIDFAAALPVLDRAQRAWLADAIADTHGDHPWQGPLRGQELRA